MRPLTAKEMLSAWEAGRGRPRTHRALVLLAYACPEISWESLAALPIGQRDARLLTLREWTFGETLSSLSECPACGERLELNFTVSDVRMPTSPPLAEDAISMTNHGYDVTFRVPNSTDLAELDGIQDARMQLLRRCVQSAKRDGKKQACSELPVCVIDAIVQRMSEVDPQADVNAALKCPSCAHTWEAAFDIVFFFWEELEGWVYRTLRDVHALASAYGWREADVLALSPWRRNYYLQLAHQ